MNTNKISRTVTALTFASLAALVSSCGSGSGSSAGVAGIGAAGGGGVSTPGACVLGLSQNVGFGATGVQINQTEIYAVPNQGTGMTTTLTGGAYSGGYQFSNGWNTAASDAYVGMNLVSTGAATSYYGGGSYTLQGALTMTALRWQTLVEELEVKYPSGYNGTAGYGTSIGYPTAGYPGYTGTTYTQGQIPPNICISEIAINVIYGPGTLQGGEIQLVLNTGDYVNIQL